MLALGPIGRVLHPGGAEDPATSADGHARAANSHAGTGSAGDCPASTYADVGFAHSNHVVAGGCRRFHVTADECGDRGGVDQRGAAAAAAKYDEFGFWG